MFLNLLEPPRMPIGPTKLSNSVESKCCYCCASYGETLVSMSCDKNFVRSGDSIRVTGLIDNTNGKNRVDSASVVLEQCLFEVASDDQNVHLIIEKNFILHSVTAHQLRLEASSNLALIQRFRMKLLTALPLVELLLAILFFIFTQSMDAAPTQLKAYCS